MYAGVMRIMALLVFLVALPAVATEVYRWVDADGQVHYSDQWQPGAEKLRIQEPAVFGSSKVADSAPPAARPGQPAATGQRYESLEIASPAQEEVLWNTEGQLRVSVRVNPSLQQGHGLRLFLDDTSQDLPAGSTEAQLKDVFRGVHTLKAQVVDKGGTVLIESQPTSFAVRQTSIANPSRPARP
jgi:Domain of unknown function (DUF4124)